MFIWFSLIAIELCLLFDNFQWFPSISWWYYFIVIDFHRSFFGGVRFCWFSCVCYWFSLILIKHHWYICLNAQFYVFVHYHWVISISLQLDEDFHWFLNAWKSLLFHRFIWFAFEIFFSCGTASRHSLAHSPVHNKNLNFWARASPKQKQFPNLGIFLIIKNLDFWTIFQNFELREPFD